MNVASMTEMPTIQGFLTEVVTGMAFNAADGRSALGPAATAASCSDMLRSLLGDSHLKIDATRGRGRKRRFDEE
jgi:hypothetical protein